MTRFATVKRWRAWEWADTPITVTDKLTGGVTEVTLKTMHKVLIAVDLHNVIYDPCSFIFENSLKTALDQENEAARKQRSARIRERREYRREAWAVKHGIQP